MQAVAEVLKVRQPGLFEILLLGFTCRYTRGGKISIIALGEKLESI